MQFILSYDILNCLADYLPAEDFLSLCLTCKALHEDVLEHSPSNLSLCEKTLKARHNLCGSNSPSADLIYHRIQPHTHGSIELLEEEHGPRPRIGNGIIARLFEGTVQEKGRSHWANLLEPTI